MSKKDLIEINGKLYDAQTGLSIDGSEKLKTTPSVNVKSRLQPSKKAVNHTKAHQPKKSELLMRQAVKRPGSYKKTMVMVKLRPGAGPNQPVIRKVTSLSEADHRQKKLDHAKAVKRSPHVAHFSSVSTVNHYAKHGTEPEAKTQITSRLNIKHLADEPAKPKVSKANILLDKALRDAKAHEEPLLSKPHSKSHHKHHVFNKLHFDRISI